MGNRPGLLDSGVSAGPRSSASVHSAPSEGRKPHGGPHGAASSRGRLRLQWRAAVSWRVDAGEIEGRCAGLARAGGPLRRALSALAGRFQALRGWERLGYARAGDYTRERLGLSARELADLARVDTALRILPSLEEALVSGELPWTKVRLITRAAKSEAEGAWIAFARRVSIRQFEAHVRGIDTGCSSPIPMPRPSRGGVPDLEAELACESDEEARLQTGANPTDRGRDTPTGRTCPAGDGTRLLHGAARRGPLFPATLCTVQRRLGACLGVLPLARRRRRGREPDHALCLAPPAGAAPRPGDPDRRPRAHALRVRRAAQPTPARGVRERRRPRQR